MEEAQKETLRLLSGETSESHIGQVLLSWNNKGLTQEEILGIHSALSSRMKKISLDSPTAFDICGTGGDELGTFNISTGTAIMLAAAGISVAKLGSWGVSSPSGSANVLREMGIQIDLPPEAMIHAHHKTGFGFFLAEHYHPGLDRVNAVRRALGVPTFLNQVLPLLHPASPKKRILGVARKYYENIPIFSQILAQEGVAAIAVTGEDGSDEISVASTTILQGIGTENGGKNTIFSGSPTVGLGSWPISSLAVKTAKESATLIQDALSPKGKNGAAYDALCLNAAVALSFIRKMDLEVGLHEARMVIESGAAIDKIREIAAITTALQRS